MSVYNAGVQGSQVIGGYLYDWIGYVPLVLVSAGATALTLLLVPLVRIGRIEARAIQRTAEETAASSGPGGA
jgi:predicted MFS family arabinose efflux permease